MNCIKKARVCTSPQSDESIFRSSSLSFKRIEGVVETSTTPTTTSPDVDNDPIETTATGVENSRTTETLNQQGVSANRLSAGGLALPQSRKKKVMLKVSVMLFYYSRKRQQEQQEAYSTHGVRPRSFIRNNLDLFT